MFSNRHLSSVFAVFLVACLSASLGCGVEAGEDDSADNGENQNADHQNTGNQNQNQNNQTQNQNQNNQTQNQNQNNQTQNQNQNNQTQNQNQNNQTQNQNASNQNDLNQGEGEIDPASYVTELEIADDDCCFDFREGGAGEPDNALFQLLEITADVMDTDLDEVNEELQGNIDDGELAIVFEHSGLTGLEAGQEFTIHVLSAEDVAGGEATIDPESFDDGGNPHHILLDAELSADDVVAAGPGTLELPLDMYFVVPGVGRLGVELIEVQLAAHASTGVDGGVALDDGQLGGLILIEEIVAVTNDFASDCECLDHPDPLIHMEEGNPQTIECDQAIGGQSSSQIEQACADTGEEQCGELGANCDMISFLGIAADIDSTDDGIPDAISAGFRFEAHGVNIIDPETE